VRPLPQIGPTAAASPLQWRARLRWAGWRHASGLVSSAVTVTVALLFGLFAVAALIDAVRVLPRVVTGLSAWRRGHAPWTEGLYAMHLARTVFVFPAIYVGYFVVAFLVTLPVSAPLVVFWHEPPRFVLLRPFNRRPLSRGLARLVRQDVARFGHTYTLADSGIRVPWYVRVPVLLGQFALLSFRARTIRRPQQVGALEGALRRTWLRNINWCLAWRKVFPVRTDDGHWQQVVERLVRHATLVFIDLTELRPNVRWEVDLIRRLDREHRVVYLLHADAVPTDLGPLGERLGYALAAERVHGYGPRGARERARLRAALARAIEETGAHRERPLPATARRLAVAGVAAFALGCFPLLALGVFEALPERLGQLSRHALLGVYWYALGTWVLLWLPAYWHRRLVGLALVQTLLLVGLAISS
jgi:hypothetical protein